VDLHGYDCGELLSKTHNISNHPQFFSYQSFVCGEKVVSKFGELRRERKLGWKLKARRKTIAELVQPATLAVLIDPLWRMDYLHGSSPRTALGRRTANVSKKVDLLFEM